MGLIRIPSLKYRFGDDTHHFHDYKFSCLQFLCGLQVIFYFCFPINPVFIYKIVRQIRVFPVLTYIENTIHPLSRSDVSPDFTTDFYYIKIISILYNNFQKSFIKLIKILIIAKSETFIIIKCLTFFMKIIH